MNFVFYFWLWKTNRRVVECIFGRLTDEWRFTVGGLTDS